MKRFLHTVLVLNTLLASSACSTLHHTHQDNTEHRPATVGVLLDGRSAASQDIIATLRQTEPELKRQFPEIEFLYQTTDSDPNKALQALKVFEDRNVRFIVGPETSGEVAFILSQIKSNGMVLISPSSTAPFLNVADDPLYRMLPTDVHQARALSDRLKMDQVKNLFIVARNDIYGQLLSHHVSESFKNDKSSFAETFLYDCSTTHSGKQQGDAGVWKELIEHLQQEITRKPEKSGILLVGFDEIFNFVEASVTLPESVVWYGSESLSLDEGLTSNKKLANLLSAKNALFISFATDESVKLVGSDHPLAGRSFEALAAHDAAWLAAHSERLLPETGGDVRAATKALLDATQQFKGLTGAIHFDEAGDRSGGFYEFWRISPASLKWQRVTD